MTYTLTNCTALAFDLVRRPHGSTATAILLTALTATPSHLQVIAASAPGHAAIEPQLHTRPWTKIPSDRTTVGDPTSLHRLVHTDILGSNNALNDVSPALRLAAADTITAALTRAWHAPPESSAGQAPTWVHPLPADTDLGPHTDRLFQLLYEVASATPADRTRRRAAAYACTAHDELATSWTQAMHEATWAVHLAGRTHAHALTQLLTVQAYLLGGFTTTDTHIGVWNAISGTASATLVSDLLPTSAHRRLMP